MSSFNFSFSKIMARLKKLSGAKNNTALAALLGFKPAAFSLRKKDGSIPFEEIIVYAGKENKSTDWIFYGRGEPDEPGFGSATPQEKEFLNEVLKVYRNPATKEGLESTVHTMAKVPASEVKAE